VPLVVLDQCIATRRHAALGLVSDESGRHWSSTTSGTQESWETSGSCSRPVPKWLPDGRPDCRRGPPAIRTALTPAIRSRTVAAAATIVDPGPASKAPLIGNLVCLCFDPGRAADRTERQPSSNEPNVQPFRGSWTSPERTECLTRWSPRAHELSPNEPNV
jgi:hypothetical protein